LIPLCAIGAASGEESVKGQAPAASAPAESRTSGDARVDRILDRLEVKGQAIKGLRCGLLYRYVIVDPVEEATEKEGELLFARSEPNSKFLVHFRKLVSSGTIRETGEYFAFDGEWLTERNDKARTIVRRQIARPGERKDPFRLGQGPFPLPFGQKRDDILRNFEVNFVDFSPGDPKGSDHLHCVPRPNTELAEKYSRVEIFVDRRLELPVRIVCEKLKDGTRIEVDFRDIDANEAPAGSRFIIEQPRDFDVSTEPLSAEAEKGRP